MDLEPLNLFLKEFLIVAARPNSFVSFEKKLVAPFRDIISLSSRAWGSLYKDRLHGTFIMNVSTPYPIREIQKSCLMGPALSHESSTWFILSANDFGLLL